MPTPTLPCADAVPAMPAANAPNAKTTNSFFMLAPCLPNLLVAMSLFHDCSVGNRAPYMLLRRATFVTRSNVVGEWREAQKKKIDAAGLPHRPENPSARRSNHESTDQKRVRMPTASSVWFLKPLVE